MTETASPVAWLAEHWSENCPALWNPHFVDDSFDPPRHPSVCPDCDGSGKRYPFRQPCPKCKGGGKYFNGRHYGWYACLQCRIDNQNLTWGLGYLPNVTDATLGPAIRARGWTYEQQSHPDHDGDSVSIVVSGQYLGLCNADDGLRDLTALTLAAARADGYPE